MHKKYFSAVKFPYLLRNEKIFLSKIYEVTPNHDLHQLTRHDLAKDQLKECVKFGID